MIQKEVRDYYQNRETLVTGGTGLIGRYVVLQLLELGARVTVVSLDEIDPPSDVAFIKGDLTDFGFCREVSAGMEVVFHVAGIKGSLEVTWTKPASFFVPLLQMNTNILEAARMNRVQKILYTSSIGAYPSAEVFIEPQNGELSDERPPMDHFPGWAKRMAEMQIRSYQIQYGERHYAVVRPCNVYGPGDNFDPDNAMVIPSLMARIHGGENPLTIWGDGKAIRDFAFSKDVARGMIQASYYGTEGGFVNLGSGCGCSIEELVSTLETVVPFEYEFDLSKPSGFPKRIMDISKAQAMIGYQPTTSLREGLKQTWDWFCQNPTEYEQRKNYFRAELDGVGT